MQNSIDKILFGVEKWVDIKKRKYISTLITVSVALFYVTYAPIVQSAKNIEKSNRYLKEAYTFHKSLRRSGLPHGRCSALPVKDIVIFKKARGKGVDLYDLVIAENLNHSDTAKAYIGKAHIYVSTGDVDLALYNFGKSIEIDDDNIRPYIERSLCYEAIGKYSSALEDINMALQMDSQDSTLYQTRGKINFSLGNYKSAITDFSKYIQFNANDPDVYLARGYSYLFVQRYNRAKKDFEMSTSLYDSSAGNFIVMDKVKNKFSYVPEHSNIHYALSQCYIGLHDLESAEKELYQSISSDPNNPIWYSKLAKFYLDKKAGTKSGRVLSLKYALHSANMEKFQRSSLLIVLARAYALNSEYKKAIVILSRIPLLDQESVSVKKLLNEYKNRKNPSKH